MSDNLKEKAPHDSSRINVHENYEIQYWTRVLNVSREQLISAVNKVGVMVEDVRSFLTSSGQLRRS
ncbi:MAG TPA: DUF3606 domain-containing protein [Bacteriovoracaceae bacterium]|nr:DUF3606 domain-containing protein [Bacteriovoracaceae bacterium]